MAVSSTELHWNGSTGDLVFDKGLIAQYAAVYKVKTTTPLDNAQIVLAHFVNDASLPTLGSIYEYGLDLDPAAVCYSIKPKRRKSKSTMWDVVVSYKTPATDDDDTRPDESDNLTNDPREWRPEFSVRHYKVTRPVYTARYLGGFTGTAESRYFDPETTVYDVVPMNSAFIPFDPPLEREVPIKVVSIRSYTEGFESFLATSYIDNVNDAEVTIDLPWYFDVWQKYAAKIEGIDATLERRYIHNNNGERVPIDFFQADTTVEIDPTTWVSKVPDRGVAARMITGDPDGRGGTISVGDLVDGMPRHRHLVDADDNPVTEPVLFNGDGQPLDIDDAESLQNPVILEYMTHPLEDFTTIEFLSSVVKPS